MSVTVTETVYPFIADPTGEVVTLPFILGLAVGATVYVSADSQPDQVGVIAGLKGNAVTINSPGGSSRKDLSAYTVNRHGRMTMPAQTISGISSVPSLPAASFDRVVDLSSQGLLLDGVTPDDVAFQAALAANGSNKRYRIPAGGNMLIANPLTLNYSNVALEGAGPGLSKITMAAAMTAANSNAITVNSAPTFGTSRSLVANAKVGDTAVTLLVAQAAEYSAGDYVLIRSNREVDTGKKCGEIKIVSRVDQGPTYGQVYFYDRVYDSYLVSDAASMIKISFLKQVTLSGLSFTSLSPGPTDISTGMVWAKFVDKFKVINCEFVDSWYTALDLTSCLNSSLSGDSDIDHVQTTTASATIRYGVWVASACQGIRISGNYFHRTRHAVTVGTHSGTNFEGVIRNLLVSNNHSVAADTAHFDVHQPIDGGAFIGNTMRGGISYLDPAAANVHGIQIRGKNIDITGNTITGMSGSGISIQGDTLNTAQGINITGNNISECYAPRVMTYLTAAVTLSASFTANVVDTSSFTASGTVQMNATDSFTYTGKTATTLTGCVSSQTTVYAAGSSISQLTSGGIGIQVDSAVTVSGMNISGNIVEGTDSAAVKCEGNNTGVSVRNNTFKNNSRFFGNASVQISAAGPCTVRNNRIEGNVTGRPVAITGSDGHVVMDNDFINNFNQTPSVAGATSYVRDNGGIPADVVPSDHGLLAWNYAPGLINTSSTPLATAGTVYVMRMHLPLASSITNVNIFVITGGGTLTTGQCFAGLYKADGTLVGTTADQASAWASSGYKSMALVGGPYVVPAGDIFVAVFFNGSTGPALTRTAGVAAVNIGLSNANSRYGTADTLRTTSMPSPLGSITALSVGYWASVS